MSERRAWCMGTVPHDEHPFNGGMWCDGLKEEPLPPHPSQDAEAQRARRIRRFGAAVVQEMEAKVDSCIAIAPDVGSEPCGLSREDVLSLMEGMYSQGWERGIR